MNPTNFGEQLSKINIPLAVESINNESARLSILIECFENRAGGHSRIIELQEQRNTLDQVINLLLSGVTPSPDTEQPPSEGLRVYQCPDCLSQPEHWCPNPQCNRCGACCHCCRACGETSCGCAHGDC